MRLSERRRLGRKSTIYYSKGPKSLKPKIKMKRQGTGCIRVSFLWVSGQNFTPTNAWAAKKKPIWLACLIIENEETYPLFSSHSDKGCVECLGYSIPKLKNTNPNTRRNAAGNRNHPKNSFGDICARNGTPLSQPRGGQSPDSRYSIAVIIIKARITPASSRTSPTPNRSFLSIFWV